jgi:hypothetical protein
LKSTIEYNDPPLGIQRIFVQKNLETGKDRLDQMDDIFMSNVIEQEPIIPMIQAFLSSPVEITGPFLIIGFVLFIRKVDDAF